MKNDFEKLCDEIESCSERKKCEFNPIICAQSYVKEYIHGDRTRLLRIKAEAKSILFTSFFTNLFSIIGFAIASFSLVFNVSSKINSKEINGLGIAIEVIVLCLLVGILVIKFYYRNVSKWQQYVIAAIEELEHNEKNK